MPLLASPQILSTPEFFARVEALSPQIAVFDCDGTLWSGDAGSSFMRWSIETGLLAAEKVKWLNRRYEAYLRDEVSEAAICGEMVQVYAGLPERRLREAAYTFVQEYVAPNLFAELLDLIDTLQKCGADLWAVSSTNKWVIEEGVRHFGIPADRVLAARVGVNNGVITESLVDVPSDEGKVDALKRAGIESPDAVFGNSIHDAAMLAIGRQAFPINPTPGLIARSVKEGWAVFHPGSVSVPSDPDA